jgi:CheY-like chemotaxis protein
MSDKKLAGAASSSPIHEHHMLSGIRVLLVVDDSIVRMVVQRTLRRLGGEVETTSSGEGALETLRSSLYSIVLLDLDLPGIDGLTVAKEIRDRRSSVLHHEVAIVALTARSSDEDRRRAAAAGIDVFLTKPVRVREFLRTIRNLTDPARNSK